MKKLVTLILALAMIFSVMSFASADEPFEITIMLPEFPARHAELPGRGQRSAVCGDCG